METDPITLYIALDGKHKASGDIYIDDGKSFDFKSGKYAYRRINYEQVNEDNHEINSIRAEYNDLNSTQENTTNGGNFEAENKIERIVLMGIEKKPASITLFTSSNDKVGTSLEFDVDLTTINTIIIKRPGCHIANDWRVSIQF
jgi:alpha 1,3-glucosidase